MISYCFQINLRRRIYSDSKSRRANQRTIRRLQLLYNTSLKSDSSTEYVQDTEQVIVSGHGV